MVIKMCLNPHRNEMVRDRRTSLFCGLLKIRNQDVLLHPFVSVVSSVTYPIVRYLADILKIIVRH